MTAVKEIANLYIRIYILYQQMSGLSGSVYFKYETPLVLMQV